MGTKSSWHLRKVRVKKVQRKGRKKKKTGEGDLSFLPFSPFYCTKATYCCKVSEPKTRRASFNTLLPFLKPRLHAPSSACGDGAVPMPALGGKPRLSSPVGGRMWSRRLANMHLIFAVTELWYQTDLGLNPKSTTHGLCLPEERHHLSFLIYKTGLIAEHSSLR